MVERLHIRSAHDIVAALESRDVPMRLALCQAAAAQPAHILAYAEAAGVDLIAAFLAAAARRESLVMRKATLGALVHFDDPRVVALFREVLMTSSESDVLRLAAQRVALDASPESRRFLRERLLSEAMPLRVRCIAGALSTARDLGAAEKLRLTLAGAAGGVEHWPERDPECAAGWARELGGPFALSARRLLERHSDVAALLALVPHWSAWTDSDRAWFLGWGRTLFGREAPPFAVRALLREALAQSSKAVMLAALRWFGAFPSSVPESAIEPLATGADVELRFAALSALPSHDRDWWHIARTDREPSVRALAIERALTLEEGAPASEELAEFISDGDWRVRAAVVRALNRDGAVAVDRARDWLAHADPRVRAGALQILLDQGQERWLANTLMG